MNWIKMFNLEKHKCFFKLISPISDAQLGNGFIDIPFSEAKEELATSLEITNEKIVDQLRLIPKKEQFLFFKNINEFRKILEITEFHSIMVVDGQQVFSYINNQTFINFEEEKGNYLFTNAKLYLEFIKFLKSLAINSEKEFHFIDSLNPDFRKITLINFSEKGRLNISYPLEIPNFDDKKDFTLGLEAFKSCFLPENKTLPKFLKSALIKVGSTFDENVRSKKIFEALHQIVEKANINFEVYLNEISIDKLKKDYDEIKTKYFKELSETLGKITQKIVALPIGVAASLIAIDRVSDSSQFLFLLLGVIIATSILLSVLINSNLKELSYLQRIFLLDYKFLTENKFFSKYPGERELFSDIKKSFLDKLSFYFILSYVLYFAINFSNLFLIIFIFKALNTTETAIYSMVIISMLMMGYFLVWKMEKKPEVF